jgi:endonuclease/exonuclease/phosphatase (EEP) superfamily protein YafD
VSGDFVVAALATLLYLVSLISAVHGILFARLWYRPLLFGAMVLLLMAWSGYRWWRLTRPRGG